MVLSASRPHRLLRPLLRGFHRYARELVQLLEAERRCKAQELAEAKRARVENEERMAAKAAAEQRAFEQDFRQALMKERAEKLESLRKKPKLQEQKKAQQRKLLSKKSGRG